MIEQARDAYERRDWETARTDLLAAREVSPLDGADTERLAWCCRWLRDMDGFIDGLERAEALFRVEGDLGGAARMALESARHNQQMHREVVALAAFERALGHLDELPECPEHAQALWSQAYLEMSVGGLDDARGHLDEALAIARRTGDPGVEALVVQGLAHIAIVEGRRTEGLELLDRATSLVMSGNAAPIHAGHVYCATISACRALCDWRRATEWTEASTRWCERESISGYTGLCRFHRAEIDRLHGRLRAAEAEAENACAELLAINRYGAGWAFSELADIRARLGDLDGAEKAVRRAIDLGADGEPGRGRLLLARGDAAGAYQGLDRALESDAILALEARIFLLPLFVTAAIAIGEAERAEAAATELAELADRLETDGPRAAAIAARGQVALAHGDAGGAAVDFRAAFHLWCDVDAPFEAADARVLLGRALLPLDEDAARIELEAARRTFESLGAVLDVTRTERLLRTVGSPHRETTTRTFLFSDIVQSTALLGALGDAAWETLLAWHDRTLRDLFTRHGGEEVKHEGDGFFISFDDPGAAIDCACEVQTTLRAHRTDHGFAPAVRIGVHTGDAIRRDDDYFGGAVNQTARIASAAGSGEVLVSANTFSLSDHPQPEIDRRMLELKGIPDPVEVVLVHAESVT